MNIETELKTFIETQIVSGRNVLLAPGEPLVSGGIVDSIGLLQILSHIERRWGVDLLTSGDPNDFDTIEGLAIAVRRACADA